MAQNNALGGGPPTGIAGGDLSQLYPNPTVSKLNGNAITAQTLGSSQDGYVLTWDNADGYYLARPLSSAVILSGDVSGLAISNTVNKINGISVSATTTANKMLVATSSSVSTWSQIFDGYVASTAAISVSKLASGTSAQVLLNTATPAPTWTTLSGDMTVGSTGTTLVSKINGTTVSAGGALTTGNGLYVSGISALTYSALNLAGGVNYVTGVLPKANQGVQDMVGDVSGNTGASVVDKLKGKTLATALSSIGATQDGYVLTWVNGSTEYQAKPIPVQTATGTASGDLSGTYPSPTVAKINGSTVPAGGSLTTGNLLYVSGAGALSYGALNLAGGSNYVSGLLPNTNQAAQTLTGDVSGNTGASVVDKLKGKNLATAMASIGAAQDGYILSWVNGSSEYQMKPAPSGSFTAGGDLTGTDTNQTVAKIQGVTISTTPVIGYVLKATSTSSATWQAESGGGGGTQDFNTFLLMGA